MAIEVNNFILPTTPQHVHDILQRSTDEFGIFLDLDRIYELQYIMHDGMLDVYKLMCQLIGKRFNINTKQEVIDILVSMGVPYQEFEDGTKLNANIYQAILENEDYSEVIHAFTNGYSEYQKFKTRYNTLCSYSNNLYPSELWSTDGHRLVVAHPLWKILSTSRMATSDPNLQGLARDYADVVAEPEGYNLIRCDSSQIEPRINWSYYLRDELMINLITVYNDAYLGILEYCSLTDEEEALYRADFSKYQKKEATPDFKEKRQTIKRLTNAASYGSTNLGNVDGSLARAYDRKIVKHPKRLELESKIRDQVSRGDCTFYGAFGTPVTPEQTQKYSPGSTGWTNHVIRCGINNPVQTTASELMMISVNEAVKILSKAEDSHIAFYKHDEGCFYVSDADKANGILDELSDITAYNVQGWIPIPADPEYGRLAPSTFKSVLP